MKLTPSENDLLVTRKLNTQCRPYLTACHGEIFISQELHMLKWVTWALPHPFWVWFVICLGRLDVVSLCTKLDNSSLSHSWDDWGPHNLKWVMLHNHAPFRDSFVVHRPEYMLSTWIVNLKSTFTHNEDMKGNAKCRMWGGLVGRGPPRSSAT